MLINVTQEKTGLTQLDRKCSNMQIETKNIFSFPTAYEN